MNKPAEVYVTNFLGLRGCFPHSNKQNDGRRNNSDRHRAEPSRGD